MRKGVVQVGTASACAHLVGTAYRHHFTLIQHVVGHMAALGADATFAVTAVRALAACAHTQSRAGFVLQAQYAAVKTQANQTVERFVENVLQAPLARNGAQHPIHGLGLLLALAQRQGLQAHPAA